MGIFDMVFVDCPHCGAPVEFQTKEGDPYMKRFTLADAPTYVLIDIMNSPNHCEKCDRWMALIDPANPLGPPPRPKLSAVRVVTPENPRTHFQGFKWWPDGRAFTLADIEPSKD